MPTGECDGACFGNATILLIIIMDLEQKREPVWQRELDREGLTTQLLPLLLLTGCWPVAWRLLLGLRHSYFFIFFALLLSLLGFGKKTGSGFRGSKLGFRLGFGSGMMGLGDRVR